MTNSSEKPISVSPHTALALLSRLIFSLIIVAGYFFISPLWEKSPVFGQEEEPDIWVFGGHPAELPADNTSETLLEMNLNNCTWGGYPIDSKGLFNLQSSTTLGSISNGQTLESPLILKAGSVPGDAVITVEISYCPPGGVMLLGVCSDPTAERAKCTLSTTYTFYEVAGSEENQDQSSSAPAPSDQQPQSSSPSEPKGGETTEQPEGTSLAELYDDLEDFLAGEGITAPTPGQMTASGIAITTLLAGWLVLNQMAGTSTEKSFEVIKAWKKGERPPIGAEADIPTDFWDGGIEGHLPDEDPDPTDDEEQTPAGQTPVQEGSEDRLLRGIKDAQDHDDALKKTNKDIEAFEGKIPDQLKNAEAWKKHVGPKLKQAKDLLKKGELDKARTWLDRAEKILEVRKDIDRELDHLPVEQREGVVRLVQALKVGGHVLSDGFNASVIEPAKAYGSKFLPAEQAQQWEKAMDETGQAISEVGQGIPKAVQKVSRDITHGEMMEQAEQMSQDSSPEIRKDGQQMKDLYKRENVDHFDPWGKGTKKAKELWNHTMRAIFHDR